MGTISVPVTCVFNMTPSVFPWQRITGLISDVIEIVCGGDTETGSVVAKQPGAASNVNVNVALPELMPVTRPALVTDAIDG